MFFWCKVIQTLSIIQLNKLTTVPHSVQELDEILLADDDRSCIVVGMETQSWGLLKVLVDEEMDVVLRVVDEAEGGDAAGLQAEVFLHTGLRGKGEFALVKALLQVVDVHLMHALEDDELMLVALVFAE